MTFKEATRVGFSNDGSSLDGVIQRDARASIPDPLLCGALDAKALCPLALTRHGAVLLRGQTLIIFTVSSMAFALKNSLEVMTPDFVNGQ